MSFKDILAPILSVKDDEAALAAAEIVTETWDAHLTALLIEVQPDPVYTAEGELVSVVWADVLAKARKQFEAEKKKLDARAMQGARPITTRELSVVPGLIGRDAGVAARYAELAVLLRPSECWQEDLRSRMFEGSLFGAGRSVLLAPPNWRKGAIGRNIAIASNGKREAARALGDAAPFLERSEKITFVTVGAGKGARDFGPGASDDAAAHLVRRGLRAEVRNIDDLGLGEAKALFAEAKALNADLVVMGGYGRSRLGEFVFGGVTRDAIKTAEVPLFMSH